MTKLFTIIKTILACVLVLSLSLNYLTYYGKLDMFGAGNTQTASSSDYLTELASDVKPVNLRKKK